MFATWGLNLGEGVKLSQITTNINELSALTLVFEQVSSPSVYKIQDEVYPQIFCLSSALRNFVPPWQGRKKMLLFQDGQLQKHG